MGWKDTRASLRDAADIMKRARGTEKLAALLPTAWRSRFILNESLDSAGSADPTEAAEARRKLRNQLSVEAIDEQGRVDYAGLATSGTYAELERAAALLKVVDPAELASDEERLAFWINIYNVLAIHAVIALDVRESVMAMPQFFARVGYRVGEHDFTGDDIEHGVLRRNYAGLTGRRSFKADDPRVALSPTVVDARIHFALVCASASCPAVAFYEASKLDAQLDMAAANYIANEVHVDDEARELRLPIIFRYYSADFGMRDGIRDTLKRHGTDAVRAAVDADWPWAWRRYDWSLNQA